jgi:hypothetical protein
LDEVEEAPESGEADLDECAEDDVGEMLSGMVVFIPIALSSLRFSLSVTSSPSDVVLAASISLLLDLDFLAGSEFSLSGSLAALGVEAEVILKGDFRQIGPE